MRITVTGVLTLLVVGLLAQPAAGHAQLIGSGPAAGAALDTAPLQIVLTFNENIETEFAQIQVTTGDGTRVDVGTATVEGPVARIGLQPLSGGAYNVAFRVISADGHPIEAGYAFDVTAATPPSPVAPASPDPTPAATTDTTPTPAAAPATPTPSELDLEETTATGETSPLLPVLAVLLGVAVVGGGAYVLMRRRQQNP